jgi:hypothetical protein
MKSHIDMLSLRQIERLGYMFYFGPLPYRPEIDKELVEMGLATYSEEFSDVSTTAAYQEYRDLIRRRYHELAGISRNGGDEW